MITSTQNSSSGLDVNISLYSAENGVQASGYGSCMHSCQPCLLTGGFGVGWLNNKSRMNREVHVRFCEQLKGELPFGWLDQFRKASSIPWKPSWCAIKLIKTVMRPRKRYLSISRSFITVSGYIPPTAICRQWTTKYSLNLLNFVSGKVLTHH